MPLSLHTLPAAKTVVRPVKVHASDAPDDTTRDTKERGIPLSAATIPRLISVVEIIKREYLKTVEMNDSHVVAGLHQYNEIGYLEQRQALALALEGTN
jgi:hypothetical protein